MKALVKFLLLASFFVLAFVPIKVGQEWIIIALILLMLLLVSIYYLLLYWVSIEKARTLTGVSAYRYTCFCALVTGSAKTLDLQRGRLLIDGEHLYVVSKGQQGYSIELNIPIEAIEEYYLTRLLTYRRGIVFRTSDEQEYRLVLNRPKSQEPLIKTSLGW